VWGVPLRERSARGRQAYQALLFSLPRAIHLGHSVSLWHVRANLVTILWLFVIFGEHQAMAQLIAKRVLISPLINKDLPVRHPSPRSWQFCVRDPESPKVTKTRMSLS
jgi:hypothetical protein